jgi:DNA-binding IclR family transcriptional regulator
MDNLTQEDASQDIEKDRRFVTALARGLEILDCFKFEDRPLGNREISDRTGLPKATVSRLTYTLTELGYLRYSENDGNYNFGPSLINVGYSLLSRLGTRRLARPLMQALAEHSQGAVNLAVREGLYMVYLDTYRSSSNALIQLDVGSKLPLATSALGRAYLCALSADERAKLLEQIRLDDEENWPEVKAGIEQALKDYQQYGYCQSLGAWRTEVNAVSVPLILSEGFGVMAFSCGGPSFQMTEEKIETDIGPRLLNLVRNVKTALNK